MSSKDLDEMSGFITFGYAVVALHNKGTIGFDKCCNSLGLPKPSYKNALCVLKCIEESVKPLDATGACLNKSAYFNAIYKKRVGDIYKEYDNKVAGWTPDMDKILSPSLRK